MSNHFSLTIVPEKKELDLEIVKVSGRKTEPTDNKIHNVFVFKDWEKKRKTKINKIDSINIRGQQSFLENSMNSIKIRIENDMVKKNKIWKYKKIPAKFTLEGLLFSSSVQNQTQKFIITTTALLDAKYSFVYRKIYQAIGVVKLNEINGREKN